MPAKITVIVPTYNRATMLPESIHSILAQTRMINEIIIWDDGSTDNTAEVAQKLGSIMAGAKNSDSVPDLHYFKTENGGKSRALNLALEKAQGDYIWICDDDDLGLPHAVQTMADLLDADPTLLGVGGCYRRFTEDPATGARTEQGPGYWPDLSHGSPLRHLLEDIFLFQNATMVRKSAYDAVGPFREDLNRSIDYDMITRLACAGPIKALDDPLFLQRKHDGDRGPAAARHAAAESDTAWKAADLAVFAPFRSAIPLSLYEAMYEADDPKVVKRAALLQRACVFARRTDWETAALDFADASKLAPAFGLSKVEKDICRRALAGKHGCTEAFAPDIRRSLREVAGRSAAGASIAKALARGAAWRGKAAMREKRYGEAAAIGAFVSALTFPAGTHGWGNKPGRVVERDVLPAEAYCVIKT